MDALKRLIGRDKPVDDVARQLKYAVQGWHAPVVGAMLVTCSDESEQEEADAFQQWFVRGLLPASQGKHSSAFRIANLGARYEWGAVRIAEEHYAGSKPGHAFKTLLCKVTGHVAVEYAAAGPRFGRRRRYDMESVFCGALHALMDGAELPAIRSLREAFESEGVDRLAMLRDPAQVDPSFKSLFAAIVSARLQARQVVIDLQDHRPESPTVYLVVPTVIFNQPGRDSELIVGLYTADYRDSARATAEYQGLGDDPSRYRVEMGSRRVVVTDPQIDVARSARDHRQLIEQALPRMQAELPGDQGHVHEAIENATTQAGQSDKLWRESVKALLWILADAAPAPLALLLFAKGLVGAHHVYTAYRLAHGHGGPDEALRLVEDAAKRIAAVPGRQLAALVVSVRARFGNAPGAGGGSA